MISKDRVPARELGLRPDAIVSSFVTGIRGNAVEDLQSWAVLGGWVANDKWP